MFRSGLVVFAIVGVVLALPGLALAQLPVSLPPVGLPPTPPVGGGLPTAPALAVDPPALLDVLRVNYFDNAGGSTDSFVRITNPGTSRVTTVPGPGSGDLCAMVYVFRPDQEFAACCGCKVTPNALLKLSVNRLVSNPLNGSAPSAGVIKIVSALPNATANTIPGSSTVCDAGAISVTRATNLIPTPTLREWGTHIDDSGAITEEEFAGANLSAAEFSALEINCAIAEGTALPPGTGSGHGTCDCTNALTGQIDP
jgi:hypothetical protein